jgi:hypothetical protein
MWRWVGIACLIYGLSSLALLFAPRHGGPDRALSDFGAGPDPNDLPSAINFEDSFPPPIVRPPSEAAVMVQSSGNHVLEWRLPPEGARLYSLALPLVPPPGSSRLVLELGATRGQELRLGLREQDGSLYLTSRRAAMSSIERRIEFAELRLSGPTSDENGRLDPEQVTAAVVISPEAPQWRGRPAPLVITLDNLRFE